MLKPELKDKLICIFGASTDEHGFYIDNMRHYIKNQEDKTYFVNRAIGGSYAAFAVNISSDDVFTCNPDAVIVHFGGNDLGYHTYSDNLEETPELLATREKKLQVFYENMTILVKKLKEKVPKVILASLYPCDVMIKEKEEIATVADNEEKAKKFTSHIYTRATMKKANEGIKKFNAAVEKIAKEQQVDYVDVYTPLFQAVVTSGGLHKEDGIHFSKKGHSLLAKAYLEYLGYENVPEEFEEGDPKCKELFDLEQTERHVQFFRRYLFYPATDTDRDCKTDEDIRKLVDEFLATPNYGFLSFARVAKANFDKFYDLREEILKKTFELYK